VSKIYAIDYAVKIDGENKVITSFIRAESASKALKAVVKVRRATVDDFIPATAPPVIPSSEPEASNE
jgi:hypothetical protein